MLLMVLNEVFYYRQKKLISPILIIKLYQDILYNVDVQIKQNKNSDFPNF